MKYKFLSSAMLVSLLAFGSMFTGCAPTIRLTVERPPTLNTAGIKRIAVMPFDKPAGFRGGDMTLHLTTVATDRIRQMNHFTMVDPGTIAQLQKSGQSIENHVDALLTGRLTRAASSTKTQQGSYKNKDGQTIYYTSYITDVEINFNYSLVRARDGSLIGPVTKTGSISKSDRNGYPNAQQLMRQTIDQLVANIGRDLAPHTVVETRTFSSDKANPAAKAPMKEALALVRSGSYKAALEAYLKIYEQHKSIAAAENAAILHEANGDVKAAADLMQSVLDATGNPKAREVLTRLNKILKDQETLATEYAAEGGNQIERTAAYASEEIQKVLIDGAKVWIYNNSNDPMTDAVIDNITADFIRKGVGIVDRDNRDIIEAEQVFSMSGSVSDDDILNVGNAAGANMIVVVGVTGTGAMRRLQVRVLDIEKGIPVLQSDTGEKWQL